MSAVKHVTVIIREDLARKRDYTYEICPDGTIKKASLLDFKTKEEAEKSIITSMHPMHRKSLIAIKVHN
jgi:hypothetical protein